MGYVRLWSRHISGCILAHPMLQNVLLLPIKQVFHFLLMPEFYAYFSPRNGQILLALFYCWHCKPFQIREQLEKQRTGIRKVHLLKYDCEQNSQTIIYLLLLIKWDASTLQTWYAAGEGHAPSPAEPLASSSCSLVGGVQCLPPSKAGGSPNQSQALSLLSGGGPAPGRGETGGAGCPLQGDFGILWFLGK